MFLMSNDLDVIEINVWEELVIALFVDVNLWISTLPAFEEINNKQEAYCIS